MVGPPSKPLRSSLARTVKTTVAAPAVVSTTGVLMMKFTNCGGVVSSSAYPCPTEANSRPTPMTVPLMNRDMTSTPLP
jgi:hypothetical protein